MELGPLLGIALALAMDALAVTVALSLAQGGLSLGQRWRLAWCFGVFQGGMTLAGWWLGGHLIKLISRYDHWVAFGLLLLVGSRMIYESFHRQEFVWSQNRDRTKGLAVFYLALATSIDALAVGLSLGSLGIKVVTPAIIIAVVAGGVTYSGEYLGRWLGRVAGQRAELCGGLLLIVIGLRILILHLRGG
ncbi:MAG: manganese efflux pump [Candidatus Aminicenantes bacterium]|nr:MAG: manganese efflux pump [Candidatus Aminicenantes bacterium]